jgi:hypothetical protein
MGVVAALCCALMVSTCSSTTRHNARAASDKWVTSTNNGLTFQHPQEWRYYPYVIAGTMETVTGYLSTDPLTDPCTSTVTTTTTTYDCGQPLKHLTADGVLITLGGGDGPIEAQPPPEAQRYDRRAASRHDVRNVLRCLCRHRWNLRESRPG